MSAAEAPKFEPSHDRSTYESHAASMRVGENGECGLYLTASTYSSEVRLILAGPNSTTGMNFPVAEARALAAELLLACDACEAAMAKEAA